MPRHAEDTVDSLLKCALIWAQLFQIVNNPEEIGLKLAPICRLPFRQSVRRAAKILGVRFRFRRLGFDHIIPRYLPLVFRSPDQGWIILGAIIDGLYLIQRPNSKTYEMVDEHKFKTLWSGEAVFLAPSRSIVGAIKKFDIRWFLPELARYKLLGFEVLAASAVIQGLALIFPIFFQVVIDKVVVHNTRSTLDVLVAALVAVAVFEVVTKALRQYLSIRTTVRIDARLGGKLFRHLVDLPLSYFKVRPAGVTVMRVSELDSIREFLTGAAGTLILDLIFTALFFLVMYIYSPFLTIIVACSIPAYAAIAILVTNPLHKRIEELYRDSAVNTSFLTETLTGVETVKALALEPQLCRRWEHQTRDFVLSDYRVQRLTQWSGNLTQAVCKITMVTVVWVGASMVIGLELSIGQFIAFNMLANQVNQPIMRLADLWRQFVRAKVAVERLGDVLNTLPESSKRQRIAEDVHGEIVFEDVTFGYIPQAPPILKNLNLRIPAGQMVAFVGMSGSGKSTLARLIQKLYVPQSGRVVLDGVNVSELNAETLRQKVGIVLQESFLFNRSVRENIAIHNPSVALEQVVEAARKAGAHEFILERRDGYDTVLSEGGRSLSGGQRQRIAIARALITDPPVLILDEATSALDDQSQAVIQESMQSIRSGRTIIVIAHRLSTVRDCDCIHIFNNGLISESGTHRALLANPDGAYRRLWDLQRAQLRS